MAYIYSIHLIVNVVSVIVSAIVMVSPEFSPIFFISDKKDLCSLCRLGSAVYCKTHLSSAGITLILISSPYKAIYTYLCVHIQCKSV